MEEKFVELWPTIFVVLVLVAFWFIIRRILTSISNKINNADLYKEDMLNVLEEIRDELKKANANNTAK